MTDTLPPPRRPAAEFEIEEVRRIADRAAEKIGAAAAYLRSNNPQDMLCDATALLRRHPVESLAVAAVLGLIVGRVIFRTEEPDFD
jgi:hypothetical protein